MEYRIYLRALEVDDWQVTYKWKQDKVYKKGVVSQERFVSVEAEKKWLERIIQRHDSGNEVRLAIIEKGTNEFIGMTFLTNINYINRNAGIGSVIGSPKHRGKGFLFEARLQLFDYAFKEIGLKRIEAKILEDNKASINSAKKFGYTQEGVMRKAVFKNGIFKNLIMFSMLKEEFYRKYDFLKV